MADQQSRGGKKLGNQAPEGQSEQHQTTGTERRDDQEPGGRPPAGQPGGPKPSAGKTRPQND